MCASSLFHATVTVAWKEWVSATDDSARTGIEHYVSRLLSLSASGAAIQMQWYHLLYQLRNLLHQHWRACLPYGAKTVFYFFLQFAYPNRNIQQIERTMSTLSQWFKLLERTNHLDRAATDTCATQEFNTHIIPLHLNKQSIYNSSNNNNSVDSCANSSSFFPSLCAPLSTAEEKWFLTLVALPLSGVQTADRKRKQSSSSLLYSVSLDSFRKLAPRLLEIEAWCNGEQTQQHQAQPQQQFLPLLHFLLHLPTAQAMLWVDETVSKKKAVSHSSSLVHACTL